MKKIVLALAVSILAVGVQANNLNWALTANAVAKQSTIANYTAYIFVTDTFDDGVSATDSSINSELLSSATDSSSFYLKTSGSSTDTYKTGNSAAGARTVTGLSGTSFAYTAVIVDTAKSKYAVVGTGTATLTDPMASGSEKNISTTWAKMQGTASSGNLTWYSVVSEDTPEPTSGLLLLVGGAMLALRRKRA